MKSLTKDEFLAAEDPKPQWVALPHLGNGSGVYVRVVSGLEFDEFEAHHSSLGEGDQKHRRLENFRARVVALCACDENGERLFSPTEAKAIGKKNQRTLQLIFDAGRKLNNIFLSDKEEEELEKNCSAAGQPDGSATE